MTFIRRKDGSLNLSIQAIVILVMAMAILGLGLVLINSLREKFVNLPGLVDDFDIPKPATADEPLMLQDSKITVKSTGSALFDVSVYNNQAFESSAPVEITIDQKCIPSGDEDTKLEVESLSRVIPLGERGAFSVRIEGKSTPPNTYVCTLKAVQIGKETTNYVEIQATISVTS
ncbi:MAG: hypothetical protein ABIB43_06150 [archaeon]